MLLSTMDACRFIGFYGDFDTANQEHSWSLLQELSRRSALPWVYMGDFNEILFANEKLDGWIGQRDKCKVLGMPWTIVD